MGEKDIAEKILLAYNDVFSDIVNVLLFGGQEVIQGNDLEDQTSSDSDMPLRVIAYDGMEYRAQLLKKTVDEPDEAKKQERYPVITMVLYFGYEHLWNGPISLKDRLKIPDGLDDYVNDYIDAESEEEAIRTAMDYLSEQIQNNGFDVDVNKEEKEMTVYKDDEPLEKWNNFRAEEQGARRLWQAHRHHF